MPLTRISRIILPDNASGTLLNYLCQRFTYRDETAWRQEIAAGRLIIGNAPATAETTLVPGAVLEYLPEMKEEPPVDRSARLLLEQDGLAFISKPANLPCHPAGCFFNNTLWAMLKTGEIPGIPPHESVHFVNRLDRETSGIIIIARNAETAKIAEKALRHPSACKEYVVLVEGDFPDTLHADGLLWSLPDALVHKQRFFGSTPPPNALRIESACTDFSLIERKGGISRVKARLTTTGRTHQIRATLRSLGYPVVGDKLYGPSPELYLKFINGTLSDDDIRLLRLPNQALHAFHIQLTLPDNRTLECTAPPPF